MTIGERLKEMRGVRTQAEAAKLIGIAAPAWRVYESDRSIPGGKLLAKMSTAFGVSTDWILGLEAKTSVVARNSAVVIGNGTATINQPGNAGICKTCEIRKKLASLERAFSKLST